MARTPFNKHSTAEEVTAGLDLTGKTALVTGCNAGIGYETMRVLALRGARVYGLARTIEKAQEACQRVAALGLEGQAIPFACEHTQFASVVACARAVQTLAAPIDMLVCNAGVYTLTRLELAEGLEKHFVVNHLSHFILAMWLLPKVLAAEQGRIVIVGSEAYSRAPPSGIEFDNLSGQRHFSARQAYGQSKLANGLFARELAKRLSSTHVTVNVLHPGWVSTATMRLSLQQQKSSSSLRWRIRGHVYQLAHDLLAKTPEQGAATTCYVATNPQLAHVTGAYFEDCHEATPGGHMRDDAMAAKLWAISKELARAYCGELPMPTEPFKFPLLAQT